MNLLHKIKTKIPYQPLTNSQHLKENIIRKNAHNSKRTLYMLALVQNNNIDEIILTRSQDLPFKIIRKNIAKYFPALQNEDYDWIRNWFSAVNVSS